MNDTPPLLPTTLFSQRLILFSVLVICTIIILYFPLFTHVPLINEETRRALVAKELLSTQHYFYASIANEAYTAKPLLFNWLIILASWFNQSEVSSLTARIPPLLSTIGLIVFFIHYTRRWWSNNTLIFFTVIFIFTPQIIRKATTAEIDMVFALLVNLSLFCWFYFYQKKQQNHAWIISCVFVALAYLCKREVALLFYILSIGGFLLWQKKLSLVKFKGALAGLMIVLTGIAVWLVPIISAYGIDVFIEQTANEISARSHKNGVGNYLLTSAIYPFEVFIALLPGALLLPLLIVKKVREDLYAVYQEKFTFCLFIVLINLVPFILLGKSNVRYYLPMFPANFILIAMIYSRCLQGSLSLNIQKWITYKLPLIIAMLTAVTIGGICLTKPLTVYATWTLPVALLLLLVYIVFAIKNKKANDVSFVYFCLVIGLSIRLLDLGYTIPRSALKVEKYRNIPMMLSALKHIKQEHNKTIIASPRLSHALYFYDNEHIISPLNCQNKVTDNHLILAISHTSELALPQNNLIKNNIIWQTYYRKNKTLYLYQPTEVNTSPDYCF